MNIMAGRSMAAGRQTGGQVGAERKGLTDPDLA